MTKLTMGIDITAPTDSTNLSLPLHLTKDARKSRLLKHAAEGIWKTLAGRPMAFHVHSRGISHEAFTNSSKMMQFYRIISTNQDRNGTVFVSTFEGMYQLTTTLISMLSSLRKHLTKTGPAK